MDAGPPVLKRKSTLDVHGLETAVGIPLIHLEKTPTHYRLRIGGHDSTSKDRHSLHVTISSAKLHEIVSSLSHHYQSGEPVLIDLVSCKILFLHRDEAIMGMNFQMYVSFHQASAAQTWGYQAAPSSNLDLDEIVPDLLNGSEACGFTSFFICKRDLFFNRLESAMVELCEEDQAASELLSEFKNAFSDSPEEQNENEEAFDEDEDEEEASTEPPGEEKNEEESGNAEE
eukprot:CAMPEP_0119130476 /NCGR_PEP_ID=MMETSP1310-20130426/7803_1 /TAXON_ID=464262 /ORGANISM="Genus nov. species nov., Strain RCC2339" /LENGTH=228 /DNA_ID=CAMNT_0007120989 /DNA_START=60 /DNA_END=746 /DNA_ORIENTATION=-